MNRVLFFFMLMPLLALSQTQIGQKIEGDIGTDAFGRSVAISADGTIVAIGADRNNGNGSLAGHVRVYENASGTWTQIGTDIVGEASGDGCGESVALSADGTIVAIGAPANDDGGADSGHVRVFENISGTWTQIGDAIEGDAQFDYFGLSVALSADGRIVAIGSREHNGNGPDSGQVKVFENVQGTWTQIGQVINGAAPSDRSGCSISLSSDGNIVAIGATNNSNANGNSSGHVRVFENVSGTWTQIGSDIIGEVAGDQSGGSIWLSSDGSIVAIGADGNDANGQSSGHVRMYQNTSNTWTQVGSDIDGEEAQDYFGGSVSLSGTGDKLIVGAMTNYTSTTKNGYAKVYDLSGVLSSDKFTQVNFTIYPNPATEVLNIKLQDNAILENVTIYNNLGQKIKTIQQNTVDVSTLAKGLYFVEVTTNHGKASKKVIVE